MYQAEAENRLYSEITTFAHDMKSLKNIQYKANCKEAKYKTDLMIIYV